MQIFKRFKPSFHWTILALILGGLLLGLGFWQLQRAQEKKDLLDRSKHQASLLAQDWVSGAANPAMYQKVKLHGQYLPITLLLDNQYDAHQWGYHILNLLELTSGALVIVDRGWIAGDIRRQQLPHITIPSDHLVVQGQAYYPSSKGVLLGDWLESRTSKSWVIERIDIQSISNLLHKKVYPFIIRLDQFAPYGYGRHWLIVSMSPERHQAYAFQWFAMAFVLLIIYFFMSLKKVDE